MSQEARKTDEHRPGLPGRRRFLQTAGTAMGAMALGDASLLAVEKPKKPPETLVKLLYDSLTDKQKKAMCFDWNYQSKRWGLLRTHLSNNWRITRPTVKSGFYTKDQQAMIRQIFEGLVNPDWITRFDRQFKDDLGGFGRGQAIAIFGEPGREKFEFVLTGRHGTIRCDGNSTDHVAFGGPILYGHEGKGYFETAKHPTNVFWHQAVEANKVYQMLDGKQQKKALLPEAPDEAQIAFRGQKGTFTGIAIAELSRDQKDHVQKVLSLLIEPYRQSDRDEAVAALKKQGGLDKCYLTFYRRDDLGNDGIWDNWRLEGPSFVWHYRGAPHVHVWINVADDPSVKLNATNLSGRLRRE